MKIILFTAFILLFHLPASAFQPTREFGAWLAAECEPDVFDDELDCSAITFENNPRARSLEDLNSLLYRTVFYPDSKSVTYYLEFRHNSYLIKNRGDYAAYPIQLKVDDEESYDIYPEFIIVSGPHFVLNLTAPDKIIDVMRRQINHGKILYVRFISQENRKVTMKFSLDGFAYAQRYMLEIILDSVQ